MGSIRKQTIISSILVYVGFAIGFVNNYFFTRNGSFTPAEYGLTRIFTDFAQNMFAFGSLGVVPIIYKFYPYYKDNLQEKEIDLITWSFFLSIIGFVLVLACGVYFEPYFIEKYQVKSPLILDYYFWMFPFAMGMLFFCVLESFSWALNLSVVSNFLKETGLRLLTAVLIALFYLKLIDFKVFIYLFSIQYLMLFVILLSYLVKSGKLHFPTTVSRVTKKFWKKMVSIQVLVFGGALIAYEIATRPAGDSDESTNSTAPKGRRVVKKKQSETIFSSTLIAGIGAVIGLLLASPPYSADAKWRSATTSQDAGLVEEALKPGYLNPENSYKYANAAQIFEGSKLYDLAYKYAKIGVEFNPDSFDAWRVLYLVSKSTPEEKTLALENMKRLDPNNPNVLG